LELLTISGEFLAPHILQVTNQALRLRFVAAWTDAALGLERVRKRRQRRAERLARGYPNPINRGRLYESVLASSGSYADVGRRLGVTRGEVCQSVTLVRRLPAQAVAAVEAERDAECLRLLSLRRLLAISRMPHAGEQRRALVALGVLDA
jgi:hypothetical protein